MPFSRLQALLLRRGTLPLADARLYAAEVALGLGGLHDERGALYRDLKPENVLLDGRGAYPPAAACGRGGCPRAARVVRPLASPLHGGRGAWSNPHLIVSPSQATRC